MQEEAEKGAAVQVIEAQEVAAQDSPVVAMPPRPDRLTIEPPRTPYWPHGLPTRHTHGGHV